MSNLSINQLPTANTIDGTLDLLPIYTASLIATQSISRNTYLNIASQPVGLTDSQTLINKTLTSPTINGATLSGTLSGTYTIGGTPTFPSSVVTLTGSQTLTNKIFTSPTINSPTITNATLTADTVSGFTVSNTGTIYGISVTTGTIGSAALASNSVLTAAITDNNVTASKLATNAITLGYAQITTAFSTSSTSAVQATGLSASVTIPSGGRRVKITAWCVNLSSSTGAAQVNMSIWDGTVGSGTQLSLSAQNSGATTSFSNAIAMAVVTPPAGAKTYNVGLSTGNAADAANLNANTSYPAFILVEAI